MASDSIQLEQLNSLAREAVICNYCFETLGLTRPTVRFAQPRWIGPEYWSSAPRVVVVMLNPGGGASRQDSADLRLNTMLKEFAVNTRGLDEIFAHQRNDMENWGRGRFVKFYSAGLGLRLERLALANIAWCASRDDKYPGRLLNNCFTRHTARLLSLLEPDVVLLSGSATHRFAGEIAGALPAAKVEPIMHYAHREGYAAEAGELKRVKAILGSVA